MTATLWFFLGFWIGCSAGFLLCACLSVARDGERQADTALTKLRGDARRIRAHDQRARMNLRIKTSHAGV